MLDGGVPEKLAKRLGVAVTFTDGASFCVATWESRMVCSWHPDSNVREQRVWEGLAQCLLNRAGIAWSNELALTVASLLQRCFSPFLMVS